MKKSQIFTLQQARDKFALSPLPAKGKVHKFINITNNFSVWGGIF